MILLCMGGREGLIDTMLSSETGYIQKINKSYGRFISKT